MHRRLIAFFCAALAPSVVLAEPIELRPGGWELTSAFPGEKPSAPERQCMSQQDLQNMRILKLEDDESESCTMQEVSQTKTHLEALQVCTGADARQVRYVIEAPTPIIMTGTISLVGGTPDQSVTFNGKWIQASCDGFDE